MGGSHLRLVSLIWSRLHEPRRVTAAAIVRYFLAALIGVGLLVLPPEIPETVPALLVGLVSTVSLIAFAGIAIVSAWRGTWWLERVAILGVIVSYLAQVPLLWPLFDTASWRVLITLSVLEACAGLMHRFFLISWAYLDPTR